MCLSRPKMPDPPAPVQEAKAPDFQAALSDRRRRAAAAGGGTLLTAPSGISLAAGNMAKPTLLGQ